MTGWSYAWLKEAEVALLPKQTFLNLPEQKSERIMQCAVAEFAQRGYKQASISRMVEAAGIAKGSFYQYFEDKDDLFVHVVATQIGSLKMDAYERESARLKELNLSEFLCHVFKVQIREFNSRPELIKISMDLMQLAGDPIYEKLMRRFEGVQGTFFMPIIKHEIEQGEIDGQVNARLLNFMLMGMGQYLIFLINTGEIDVPDQAIIDRLVEDMDFILTNGIYTEKGRRG